MLEDLMAREEDAECRDLMGSFIGNVKEYS